MKMVLKSLTILTALSAMTLATKAVPTLGFYDGTTEFFVADGSALDANPLAGVITYLGPIGNWSVNVTTGIAGGTTEFPTLDLSSVNVSTSTGGFLNLGFVSDNLGPTSGGLDVQVGGTTTGSVNFLSVVDSGNTSNFFGLTSALQLSQGSFTGAFSDSAYGAFSLNAPYSIYELAYITHNGAGTTSFDAYAAVPDGGTTALLLGLGLLGVGFIFRRLRPART